MRRGGGYYFLPLAVSMVVSAGLLSRGIAVEQPEGTRPGQIPYFNATRVSLEEAASRASQTLRISIVIALKEGHRARKRSVSLAMPVEEPNDLLNALSAAFGLRWVNGSKARQVLLVDKTEYRARGSGGRQAVGDALPEELRGGLTSLKPTRLQEVEGILKELQPEQLARLETLTATSAVLLEKLDADLREPLVRYLDSFAAYKLGLAFDTFEKDLLSNQQCRFHYGPNPGGTRQFSFSRGDGRWLVVKPE